MTVNYKNNQLFPCLLLLLMAMAGCHNYYKATTKPSGNNGTTHATVDSLNKTNRYFVLRSGSQSFLMKVPVLSADKTQLTCILDSVPYYNQKQFLKRLDGKTTYKKKNAEELAILNEVDLYISPDSAIGLGKFSLPLDKVEKIEVIEKDKGRTNRSYVLGAVGGTVAALLVATIIVAATKSSCPFVSAYDGDNFILQGEIYGGAIYPQLARHDFMPLKMSPLQDGTYQLKITNELKEIQYTDMADLWVITHDKNVKVLVDEKGGLYSIASPQPPVSATLNNKEDVKQFLLKPGDNAMLYMNDTSTVDGHNEVALSFNKPVGAKKGKLVLSLKNSYWLDLLYGELAKGFGTHYAAYKQKQLKKPAAELLSWVKEQRIPLEVAIKTTTGWEQVTAITTIGPLATRELVIPVDLSKVEGRVSIKLTAGFMFWEIDYAAIDYSAEDAYTITKMSPVQATDETGKDVLSLLQKEDGQYLTQPAIGNSATLVYTNTAPVKANQVQSFLLHAKGYYEHIRDFNNKPDRKFLLQFAKPNAFSSYGMALYKKFKENSIKELVYSK